MPTGPLLLWLLATMLEPAGADGNFSGAYMSPDEIAKYCNHGTFNRKTGACDCSADWRVAGPTDPLNLLKGSCTQFTCQSAQQCQERLGISTASCPVKGWDCYCGWVSAFSGSDWNILGPGYATRGDESAACMGPLYTLSFSVSGYIFWLLLNFWKLVLFAAIIMLPFGETNTRCTCRDPGMFRLLASITGYGATCDGRSCTVDTRWMFRYDLAWSLYVLDLALWIYCFLLILWLTFLVAWLILIWILVVMSAVVFFVMAICSASSDSGGVGGDAGEPHCCCGECDNGCCHGGFECGFLDQCCGQGYTANAAGGVDLDPLTIFWAGGPFPVGSDSDPCCGLCSGDSNSGKCFLCRPTLKLLLHLPRHPANMWGGVTGYFMGTHPMSMNVYAGGNRVVDFLGFRGRADLHGNEDWRQRVANFLQVGSSGAGPDQAAAPAQHAMLQPEREPRTLSSRHDREAHRPTSFSGRQVVSIHGRRIGRVDVPFDQLRDNCRESSFQDYARGQCWICCDSEEADQWDMWLQCGHLFCSRCSTEMLRRNMPCPLCRQVSWNVRRGPAVYRAPAHVPS